MARSHGVLKTEIWEAAGDFRRLSLDGQWGYAMLVSQPQINNLGLLPFVPEKWSRLSADLTRDRLDVALSELEGERYTITDPETGELLVRTFIRHDAVWKQPRLVTNARKLIREVESPMIRGYLVGRHPWLLDNTWTASKIARHETSKHTPETPPETPSETPSFTPPDTPLAEGVDKPLGRPLSEGVSPLRAHAQDGLPLPLGQPQPLGLERLANPEAVTPRATNGAEPDTAHEADRTALDQFIDTIELRDIP